MINDFIPLNETAFGMIGTLKFTVAANASANGSGTSYVAAFRSGEPVRSAGITATPLYTTTTSGATRPVVATDYLIGVAASTSTETAALAGTVEVVPLTSDIVWLVSPTTDATWDTQSEYDALVGTSMLIDLGIGQYNSQSNSYPTFSAGKYSISGSGASTYGMLVMPLDVAKYPTKVAVKFRQGLSDAFNL